MLGRLDAYTLDVQRRTGLLLLRRKRIGRTRAHANQLVASQLKCWQCEWEGVGEGGVQVTVGRRLGRRRRCVRVLRVRPDSSSSCDMIVLAALPCGRFRTFWAHLAAVIRGRATRSGV